jgi:hypothetical protein
MNKRKLLFGDNSRLSSNGDVLDCSESPASGPMRQLS